MCVHVCVLMAIAQVFFVTVHYRNCCTMFTSGLDSIQHKMNMPRLLIRQLNLTFWYVLKWLTYIIWLTMWSFSWTINQYSTGKWWILSHNCSKATLRKSSYWKEGMNQLEFIALVMIIIIILIYSAESGFRHVGPIEYKPRLLHFHGLKVHFVYLFLSDSFTETEWKQKIEKNWSQATSIKES